MRKTKTFQQRLENKIERVTESGCWLFTGALLNNGYGKFRDLNMKSSLAHRATYEFFVGRIPDGMYVCHKCDIPSCVNPEHLFVGTPQENQDDCKAKKRQIKYTPKLDNADVHFIRLLLGFGVNQYEVAKQFGVSQSMISTISTGKAWK